MKGTCKLCRLYKQPTAECKHPATYKVFYTDHPFVELGDGLNIEPPVREILLHSYDGDKHCKVFVLSDKGMIASEIKIDYIYLEEGRFGKVPNAVEYIRKFK